MARWVEELMLKTTLCRRLGIDYPIFSVGMGPAAGPDLAAAVSNAGGCGVLGGAAQSAPYLRRQIQRLRTLTAQPFGVNVVLAAMEKGQLETCLDERVPLLVLFWGDAKPYVEDARRRGTKVFLQVGSVEEAVTAAEAGVDAMIAQGVEAGGHVRGTTSLSVLVPAIVEAVSPVPVVAAGGVANGRGIVAALSLGAQAVSMGTRFLASAEAFVPHGYKDRIVKSTAEDTVYTQLFDIGWPGAPHRVLRNKAVIEWDAAGRPSSGQRPGENTIIGTLQRGSKSVDVPRYWALCATADFNGDLDYAALHAGESCGLVNDIKPAAEIVHSLMNEASHVTARLHEM
jgi:NAD(P)H-dependent flavin oxidoreductase YrpB (nitropropane dioxygenase family)